MDQALEKYWGKKAQQYRFEMWKTQAMLYYRRPWNEIRRHMKGARQPDTLSTCHSAH